MSSVTIKLAAEEISDAINDYVSRRLSPAYGYDTEMTDILFDDEYNDNATITVIYELKKEEK